MAEKFSLWKVPVLFIGLLAWFLFRNKTKHPVIWLLFLVLLVLDICLMYLKVANHHFMITFMVLSVVMYKYHERKEVLLINIQIIVVIVVLASVVQKLMSSQFMSGDFYYYMINRGSLFSSFFRLFPEALSVAKSNAVGFMDLQATDPNLLQSTDIKDVIPNLAVICRIFAWITVVLESMVAVAILLKPKSTWTHLLFSTMIIAILCARLETGFMALLAISGLFLCKHIKLKLLYVMIAIGCVTLIVTKYGFH